MFWLVLWISGQIADSTGPMRFGECQARQVVVEIGRPAGHEYMCMRGRVK